MAVSSPKILMRKKLDAKPSPPDKGATETDVNTDPLMERLEQLIAIADRAGLATVRVRDGDVEIEITRATAPSLVPGVPMGVGAMSTSEAGAVSQNDAHEVIRAPMLARFYRAPAPDEPLFVEVGDTVKAGDTLATLEVMKTYNDVEAPFNCQILEILVEDGEAVEYNQPLFRVKQT